MQMTRDEFSKLVLIYDNQGDQEDRLTSIDNPILVKLGEKETVKSLVERLNNADAPHILIKAIKSGLINSTIIVDKVITISNQYYDVDNLERKELINGRGEQDIIHGFKFSDSNDMEKAGITLIIIRQSEEANENESAWFTFDSYEETLRELGRITLNPTRKLDFDDEEDDGNLSILYYFLEYNLTFTRIENVVLYNHLNSEYVDTQEEYIPNENI